MPLVSLSTHYPECSTPFALPVALDHTRHPCGVLPGPPAAMEFFGQVGEDKVGDVLAHDRGELEELRDDASEVVAPLEGRSNTEAARLSSLADLRERWRHLWIASATL